MIRRFAGVCGAALVFGVLLVQLGQGARSAEAAAPPCNNYFSNSTPPENIGVLITTFPSGYTPLDVQYVDFKTYVKDVLPNEWISGWHQSAYQAGAAAVKNYGWYWVNNWRSFVFNGECYHVQDNDYDQVYKAGSGQPGMPGAKPHALWTAAAVEQRWNWLLHNNDAIYPTYYQSGFTSDGCGQYWGAPADGIHLSQYGSQACALQGKSWTQISTIYYFSNSSLPGDHTYGNWHGAQGWGPAPWWPVSFSSGTWKFRNGNYCGQPNNTFAYGGPGDIPLIGDWDGNGTYSQGVARLQNGVIHWDLRNSRTPGGPDAGSFDFGGYGAVPIVGDWDGNGTWTIGLYTGTSSGAKWELKNSNGPGVADIVVYWGGADDTPMPGKWVATGGSQPTTIGHVRVQSDGTLLWEARYSNTPGGVELAYAWGPWWARPITGDWRGADGLNQFGPGHVTDYTYDACSSPQPNQDWTLKYTPSSGGVDLHFRYERIRP